MFASLPPLLPPLNPAVPPPRFFFFLSLSFEGTTVDRRTSKCSWNSCNLLLIEGPVSGVSLVLLLPPSLPPFLLALFFKTLILEDTTADRETKGAAQAWLDGVDPGTGHITSQILSLEAAV